MHHPRIHWYPREAQAVADAALAAEADVIVRCRLRLALVSPVLDVVDWVVSGRAAAALAEAQEHARQVLDERPVAIEAGEVWSYRPEVYGADALRGTVTGGTWDLPERHGGRRGDDARQTHVELVLERNGERVSLAVDDLLKRGLRRR